MGLGRIGGLLACVGLVIAHGGVAHQKPLTVDPNADWGTRHMAEEHHIDNFDPGAFFTLHDFDNNGVWDQSEILKFYGMEDETAKDVPHEKKVDLLKEILRLMDSNNDGVVEKEEWDRYSGTGGLLPDFGLGPGHHWDIEMEYEIHHWQKYHDENTKEEDLIHPEDIAHFKKHDELEDEADRVAALDKMPVVEQNIPDKFRKDKQ